MDVERAHLLAAHGAHALTLRWFGGEGQAPGVCEIPLEVFARALDRLADEPINQLAVVGLSKGAEAALLISCVDDRIDVTMAMSPTSVVWANVGAGFDGEVEPYRSSWTWRGVPLPFVPYDSGWHPIESDGLVSYRTLYEQSLALDPDATEAAAIPVEQADTDLVLVAGHDDQVWPSVPFARALAQRRLAHDQQVEVIIDPEAGHSPVFPGQPAVAPSAHIRRGGSAVADAALGAQAWAALRHRIGLHEAPGQHPSSHGSHTE
jgi:hypothetical protein